MAVFSPTNAKVHFKAYDGNFTDALGNTAITQNNGVAMATAQKLFGQKAMFMANFSDSITFNTPSVFDVGTGDYTVGFWFHPTQLTSYDRLFATGPDSGGNPFRIYNHNGSIGVYVENDDEVPGDANHDLIINYYLGASAANQWWHIMVQRNSGTTKLYINGTEQGSSTVSYEIDNSSSPTLGADINAAATGVKGYIQDFFWTEEAVSFSQADFDPSTPEPVTFHSGNPSISSFSSSANSVDNSGDTVTLSWSVSGETKLELLKYVGGLLSSTEDVLGLSSKSVTITETVSYKIRATNDNSAVDSSSVQITLGGGQSMSFGTLLSGNAQPLQLHGRVLGGLVTGSTDKQFFSLPVFGVTPNVTATHVTGGLALRTRFLNGSGSIISALNMVDGRIANQGVSDLSDVAFSGLAATHFFQYTGAQWVNRTPTEVRTAIDAQPLNANLSDISGLATTDGGIVVGDGSNFVLEAGADARASLGLTIGTHVLAYDAEINKLASMLAADELAVITPTEMSLLDGAVAKTAVASKAVVYGAEKGILGDYVSGSVAVSGALGAFHSLRLGSAAVTATAAELNLLDASAGSSTALASGDGFIMFDADDSNNAKKVIMSDLLTYIAANDDERVQDIVGAMVSSNSESGITVTYEDGDGTLDFSVQAAATNLNSDSVGADKIIANGVGSVEIVANAINSSKILAGSVTSAQLAEVIDHSAASHALILEADGTANSGLFLKGTDNDGEDASFQVVVVGGMMQLKKIAAPSASAATTADAVGTNGS